MTDQCEEAFAVDFQQGFGFFCQIGIADDLCNVVIQFAEVLLEFFPVFQILAQEEVFSLRRSCRMPETNW